MKKTRGFERETWADWIGVKPPYDHELYSRENILALATQEGIEATEGDILYWQKAGALPYPTTHRVGRTGYAVYPIWMVDLIRSLRDLQRRGVVLRDMGDVLRQIAPRLAQGDHAPVASIPLHCKCCGQPIPILATATE